LISSALCITTVPTVRRSWLRVSRKGNPTQTQSTSHHPGGATTFRRLMVLWYGDPNEPIIVVIPSSSRRLVPLGGGATERMNITLDRKLVICFEFINFFTHLLTRNTCLTNIGHTSTNQRSLVDDSEGPIQIAQYNATQPDAFDTPYHWERCAHAVRRLNGACPVGSCIQLNHPTLTGRT
jgi:hypothetical protein